jgi:DNA-binding IclR family transcriptional regulator
MNAEQFALLKYLIGQQAPVQVDAIAREMRLPAVKVAWYAADLAEKGLVTDEVDNQTGFYAATHARQALGLSGDES